MKLVLDDFGGIVPRRAAHKLPATGAEKAHDIKLRNGRIEPWHVLCDFAELESSNRSFHAHGCCVTGWDDIVQAAEVSPDFGRFYISGRNSYLEAVTLSCKCTPTYYRLGVPAPATAPRAAGTESCGETVDARAYVYTYVNEWSEESAPSMPSNIIRVADGSSVTVTGIALPPDGYGIVAANLYRAVTGSRQATTKQQDPATVFLYVATITFPSTSYVDTVKMVSLGQALETENVRTPPDGLSNITAIDSVVRLAATKKNRIYMSENFQPHNWPVKYELTLDSTIVHMGQNNGRLFVTTDTKPYVIDVSNCDDTKCTPVTDLDFPLPDISCGHQNSALTTPFGMFYSSPLGVVLISGDGKWNIVTKKWFSRDDWSKVAPETARFGLYEGFLFIITDKVSFLLDIDGAPYGDLTGTELTTLSDSPVAMETTSTGQLLMLNDGMVQAWDKGIEYRRFLWESRELVIGQGGMPHESITIRQSANQPLAQLWSPTSVKIRTNGTHFTLISPVAGDLYDREVLNERPFRLPRVGRHTHWRLRVEGKEPIDFIDIGTAIFTVNAGA